MKKMFLLVIICLFTAAAVLAAGQPADTKNTKNWSAKDLEIKKQDRNRTELRTGNISAETYINVTSVYEKNATVLKATLSNGKNAVIKIMPATASETALARLSLKVCSVENNCTIVLKEVGQGNSTKAVYEVHALKQAKVFGMFKKEMKVQVRVDSGTGEVIEVKKPWWAFIASEPKG